MPALPEPKDDVERLCYEIAEAMYREHSGFQNIWPSLSENTKLNYLRMARIAMEMCGTHMKFVLLTGGIDAPPEKP